MATESALPDLYPEIPATPEQVPIPKFSEVPFPEVEPRDRRESMPADQLPIPKFSEVAFPEVLPFPEVAQPKEQEQESPELPKPEQGGSFDVPFPEVAGPREKTVGGFLGNVIPSAFKNAKEIGESIGMAPIHGAKAVKDVFAEQFRNQPGKWEKNPETGKYEKAGLLNLNRGGGYDTGEFFKELGKGWMDTWNRMGDTLIGKYTQKYMEQNPGHWEEDPKNPGHYVKKVIPGWIPGPNLLKAIGDAGYEDPVGVALDASVVKDVATAPLKLVGKGLLEAGDALAATKAAKVMEALPAGPKAIEAGLEATAVPNALQRTGEAIKTGAEAAAGIEGKLVGKVFGKGAELLGIDLAARKKVLQYKGEELSRVPVKQSEDYAKLLEPMKGLTEEERLLIGEVDRLGEGASPEALAFVRNNRKLFDDYAEYMKGDREKFLQDANLLDKKILKRRVEAQYALEKYGSMDEAALAQARKDIGKMREFKPSFVPSEAEIREGNGILDGMWGGRDEKLLGAPSVGRLGKVGFLERFTGKAGIALDPLEYRKRVIDGFRKVEGNIRWIQRIESDPSLVKAVGKGEGLPIPTEGIYKKYLSSGGRDRARAIYQLQLTKERGAQEAMRALARDPAVIKRWKQIAEISANPTVGKILSLEFGKWGQQPGALLRAYDAVIGLFRKGATRWSPHYYVGNAAGDAILSLMDSVGPFTLGLADKLKEYMPFQARRTASVNAEGVTTGRLGKLYDYINEVDAAGKRGIITKEVVRHLKDAGISKAQLQDALKEILPSIQELSDVEVARIQLHERIAKKVQELHGAKSPAARAAITAKYNAMATEAGTLEKMMPELSEKAAIMRPAVERANAFFADYVGMGPIQQYLFRRLIPFFPFQKSMAMLAFKLPFIAPKATFLWNRYAEFMQGMTQDPDAPPGYIPFGVGRDGKVFWVSTKGLSPFGGLRMTQTYGIEHPAFIDFIKQNPIIVTVGKGQGLKDLYSRTMPYSGELMTGVHNGAVYQYQKDGTIKKVLDEAPLVQTVAHFFPIVGTIERALFPYQLTRQGFPEYFKPELNRAGEVKYPNAALTNTPDQAIGNLIGVRTIEKSRDELRVSNAIRDKGIINDFRQRIRNAQPDEREALIEQFKDAVKGGLKIQPND